MHELEMHSMVKDHPNVIPLLDSSVESVENGKEILMLLPLYPASLLDCIAEQSEKYRNWDEPKLLKAFLDICEGLGEFHFHDPPLAHRDIKPGNVMVDDNDNCILVDFGSVREAKVELKNRKDVSEVGLQEKEREGWNIDVMMMDGLLQELLLQDDAAKFCTMAFRAPELFNVDRSVLIDERVDIWSMGCTLYAMAFGGMSPFESTEGGGSIALSVVNGHVNFPDNSPYSLEFQNLVVWMLNNNTEARPTLKEVINRVQGLV
eukprot:TRINITY_DN6986_c0_g1_i7.p1 TRINITY_DN6986_c0_g1~~TRINITY_DN6986_c0_g1_i7.p1  ORF type:complete len:262 (-),score=73.29 TRINITY_DN6986_c0_g1_i7:72-857(-)